MENFSPNSLQVLVQTVQELSGAHKMNKVMEITLAAARALTGADGAAFILKEGEDCYYADENAISPLWKGRRFPINESISGLAMLNQGPIIIEDVYANPAIKAAAVYRPTFVKSLVMVPIRTNDPVGIIGNYWATPRMATAQEVWLLQSLADITAKTIENVNNYNSLEEQVKEKTRQLEAANKEMETFTYTVAHDLRAPLRIMTGYTSMLQEGHALSAEHTRITQKIVAGGMKMANLLERLLEFHRSLRNEMHRELIPVQSLVEELTAEIKQNEPQRDISFRIHTSPDVVADPALIKQVWQQLLSNAVKYAAKTPQTIIEIGGEQTEEYNTWYIKDNGIGFDMAYYDQLFSVFKRLPGAEQFEGGGTGLANVHRIILRHGGKVWAESKPGEGATFYFSLPNGAK